MSETPAQAGDADHPAADSDADHPQAEGDADHPAPVQRYRFRVRTADGREIVSAVAAVRLPPLLHAPQWDRDEYAAGTPANLRIAAPGRNGENIHFAIERRVGDSWEAIGHTSATVDQGVARIDHEMPSLPADAEGSVEYHDEDGHE